MDRKFTLSDILIFSLSLFVTWILVVTLQNIMHSHLESFRNFILSDIERKIEKKINYSGISGAIFDNIEIREIEIIESFGDSQDTVLFINRLNLKYSLSSIIAGNKAGIIESINIYKPIFNTYFLRKRHLNEENSTIRQNLSYIPELLPEIAKYIEIMPKNFSLQVTDGVVVFSLGDNQSEIRSISLESVINENNIVFRINSETEILPNMLSKTYIPLSIDGTFYTQNISLELYFTIPQLITDYFELKSTRFFATLTQENIILRQINSNASLNSVFIIVYKYNDTNIKLSTDNFSLSDIIRLKDNFEDYNTYFSLRITGNCIFYKLENDNINYNIDFTGIFDNENTTKNNFFEIKASGNKLSVDFQSFKIYSNIIGKIDWYGTINFSPLLANGKLTLYKFYPIKISKSPITGTFFITGTGAVTDFFSRKVSIGDTVLSIFNFKAGKDESVWEFNLSALCFEDNQSYTMTNMSKLDFNAYMDTNEKNLISTIKLDFFYLNDIINILGVFIEVPKRNNFLENLTNNILITTDMSINTNFKQLDYKINHLITSHHDADDIVAVSSIYGNEKYIRIDKCHINYKTGIDIKADFNYSDRNNIIFNTTSTIENIVYETWGSITGKYNIAINSNYGMMFSANIDKYGNTSGNITTKLMNIPIIPIELNLDMNTDFTIMQNNLWNITINNITTYSPIMKNTNKLLQLNGYINQDEAYFTTFNIGGASKQLSGIAKFIFNQKNTHETVDTTPAILISLNDNDKKESFECRGIYHNNALDLHLNASNLQINRFFAKNDTVAVTGEIDVIGFKNINDFNIIYNIESLIYDFAGKEFAMTTQGYLNNTSLEMAETRLYYENRIQLILPYLSVNRFNRTLETKARLSTFNGERDFSAQIDILIENITIINSWFEINDAFNEFLASISVNDARYFDEITGREFHVNIERFDTVIKITGGPGDLLDSEIDTNGNFYANLIYPSPIQGTIIGNIDDMVLNADLSNIFLDLSNLSYLIPSDSPVLPVNGVLLTDVNINGRSDDPEYYGKAQSYGTIVRIPKYITSDVGPAPISISLAGDTAFFDPILAPGGEGKAYITGLFRFDRAIPRNFELNITASDMTPLPYIINISPIISRGLVSGRLSIIMNNNVLDISGNLTGSDSIISLNSLYPEISSQLEPNDIIIRTNIDITADKRVEFLWPNDNFPIIRTNIDSGGSIKIHADTFNNKFSIVGDIKLRSGEIFYFQRSFYIKEGTLTFNESEISFDPRITAKAEVREQSSDGAVKISIIIDDQPLNSFVPRIESEPSLSQAEILSLLGSTLAGTSNEDNQIPWAFTSAGADMLSQFTVIRRAERRVRDLLHVDMFSARTNFFQNFLRNALQDNSDSDNENNSTPAPTPILSPNTISYFDNSTIFAGKYIGSDMFVQAIVTAHYDKNRLDFNGFAFEADMGIELASPYLNIRWDLRLQPPEGSILRIPETSISLLKTWYLP